MSARIIVATAAALLVSTAAYAMFGQALLITRGGKSAVPISISPASASIVDSAGAGALITPITVTMSNGSNFAGSLTLAGGGSGSTSLPCDIYGSAGTPCVGAWSSTRALYTSYNGSLYQVQRTSDSATQNIGLLSAGGYVNAATQDSFCASTACTITRIYDQSPQHNDLTPETSGSAAQASFLPITVNGHSAYGIVTESQRGRYQNRGATGTATGSQAEGLYMVTSALGTNNACCYSFGNAQRTAVDNGPGTMTAIYVGSIVWFSNPSGPGPWVTADMEEGLYFSDQCGPTNPSEPSLTAQYVTAMVKTNGTTTWARKSADAQSGTLTTNFSGALPTNATCSFHNLQPLNVAGGIVMGEGGDASPNGTGRFFEGAMTIGQPTDATDDLIQASIVSGYGTATGGGIVALSGSNLVTARALTSADDGNHTPQVCASQNGIQICQNITVTVSASGGGVTTPPPAQAAGLTTLARNWDFSSSLYATQSNWLDCNNTDNSKEWHRGSPGLTNSSVPCDINQATDPNTGQTVMAWQYLISYNVGGGNENFVSMQTINSNGGGGFVGFPNGGSYIEIRVREDGTYNNGFNNSSGPDSLFMGSTDPSSNAQLFGNGGGNSGSGGCWYEVDIGELWQSAGGFANGNAHLYPCDQAGVWESFSSANNLPSGWAVTDYHTYGALLTGNGSGSAFVCMYVDNILQQNCRQMVQGRAIDNNIQFYPQRLIVWAGSYDPNNVQRNKKMYVQFIRVWSCPDWASQMTDHSTAHCKGSTLTSSGGLQYWHN